MATMDSGPYLNVAVFCDEAVVGQDQSLSLFRIIDTVTNTMEGPDPPDEMPPFLFRTKLVVTLKAGQAQGRYKLKIRGEAPDGRFLPEQEQVIHLEGGHTGINVITQVQLGVELEGIYWFDILFEPAPGTEPKLLSRVPLRIQYLPQKKPAT